MTHRDVRDDLVGLARLDCWTNEVHIVNYGFQIYFSMEKGDVA
jgi:hypothetical protein